MPAPATPVEIVNQSAATPADIAAVVDELVVLKTVQALIQADIASIKTQNQTAKPASHSFAFDEADLTKTSPISYNGLVKHLHLVVPNFTNAVSTMVTLVDASGRVLWTSEPKAKNASYNLDIDLEWADQLVDSTLFWTINLSGVPGGTGGTVALMSRYYGV